MVKFIDGLKHGAGFVLVVGLFVFGIYVVMGWNGLQATDGDTLTAAKWNELVSKVNGDITCPTEFTKIESKGRVFGCMQTDRNQAVAFQDAILYCHNTYGGRLPSYSEIFVGITNYDLLNEGVSAEWLDQGDYGSTNGGGLIVTTNNRPSFGSYTTSNYFRCFIPVR